MSPLAADTDRALFKRFCTPLQPVETVADAALIERAEQQLIRIQEDDATVQAYVWGEAGTPSVLLIHGWGSRATHLGALVKMIVATGFRCVAFDLTAHGRSPGHLNTLPRTVRAARAVASRLIEGPALAVIGHSFGGTAACLATCDGPVSGRRIETGTLVTISAPATLRTMTERFLRQNALPATHLEGLHQVLWDDHGYRAEDIDLARLAASLPDRWLVVHDRRDEQVPVADAERIQASRPDVQLEMTDRYGHVRILLARPVLRRIAAFLTDPDGLHQVGD